MKRILLWLLLLAPSLLQAQYGYITGKISDRFGPLPNVSINIENSAYGTFTDSEGYFAFEIDTGFHDLKIELPGYNKTSISIRLENLDQKDLNIQLESELLDADVGLGSKTTVAQNQLESPVPIDVVYGDQLLNTGQVELAQALHQILPGFYSVKQSGDDPINLVDPISLRGLGPDQILVLVNGKRRHKSAFLNVKDVFGKGSAGTDLNTIPISAIDRIEVLRDGASSQYGSDAIGGVINIILKNKAFDPVVSVYGGQSQEGDGQIENVEFNFGVPVGRTGYVNLTTAYMNQDAVNRGGTYTGPIYGFDVLDSNPVTRDTTLTAFPNQTLTELGSSGYQNASIVMNSRLSLTEELDFYSFGGINYKLGNVNATYRLPVQRDQVTVYYPKGFAPVLATEFGDQSLVLGVDGVLNEWFIDVSYGVGLSNSEITVENSNNASLDVLTPLSSFAGGYRYGHNIFNAESSREFEVGSGLIDVAFGGEFRLETYDLIDGELESYQNGNFLDSLGNVLVDTANFGSAAPGMQGYFGVSESDALEEIRSNASIYAEIDYSIGGLLVSVANRFEEYSDFGSRNNYKGAFRYAFSNQFLIRGSYSTGFKAPSLQQLFYQRASSQFIDGEFQNVQLINTETPVIGNFLPLLTQLEPETSESLSFGITSSLNRNVSLSIDAYNTDIQNRIGLLSRISIDDLRSRGEEPGFEALGEIANFYEVSDIQFIELFTNLFDTRTRGIDAVLATQFNPDFATIHFNSGFNYVETQIVGLEGQEGEILEEDYRFEASQIESIVPSYQWSNTLTLTRKGVSLSIGHTRYGESEFLHPFDNDPGNWILNENTGLIETRDQRFSAKDLINLDMKVNITKFLNLTIGALNITNQYPDKLRHSDNINQGVLVYSPSIRQFDLRGAYYYTRLNFKL